MATNFLETVKSSVGMDLAEHSATFFDEQPPNTRTAVNGTFGAILAGMIQRVSYDKGAKDLHKIVTKIDVREYDIEDIFTRSPQTVNGMVNRGTHFLPSIYPGRQREATNCIAEEAKVRKISSSKMMKVCSPLMLNDLARHVQANNLDVNGLKTYLMSQKGAVKDAVPSDFFEHAELSEFGWKKKAVVKEEPKPKKVKEPKVKKVKEVKEVPVEKIVEKPIEEGRAATGGMSLLKWLIPFLLLIGLIFLLVKGCGGTGVAKATAKYVPPAPVEAIENVTQGAVAQTKNLFGSVNEAAKSALSSISFAAGSAGEQMMGFIKGGGSGDARFRFKNLNFASGSAIIDGSTGVEVDNMAAIMKAYPDVKVTIEGYTDSKGNADSNQVLSQQRADAVRTRLVAAGITEDRMLTQGFGAANPIADNETPEGRAENRRIEVVVAK